MHAPMPGEIEVNVYKVPYTTSTLRKVYVLLHVCTY